MHTTYQQLSPSIAPHLAHQAHYTVISCEDMLEGRVYNKYMKHTHVPPKKLYVHSRYIRGGTPPGVHIGLWGNCKVIWQQRGEPQVITTGVNGGGGVWYYYILHTNLL